MIDAMLQHGYNFGGEQSGHLIFGDHASTGDGLVAALQILRIMAAKQQPSPSWPSAGRVSRKSLPTYA